jgi:hypothetical protein
VVKPWYCSGVNNIRIARMIVSYHYFWNIFANKKYRTMVTNAIAPIENINIQMIRNSAILNPIKINGTHSGMDPKIAGMINRINQAQDKPTIQDPFLGGF